MLVLGIETSSQRGSVALLEDDELLLELSHDQPNAHAEQLIVLINELFKAAQRARSQIDRVAVGVGPGSFTGLRVGIALAQGIALGLGVPVFGIPSLRSMAFAAVSAAPGDHLYCPIFDARRGEAFVAAFDRQLTEVLPVTSLATETLRTALPQLLGGRAYRSCGDFATQLDPNHSITASGLLQFPSATACARLAATLVEAEAGDVAPLYVRAPDAILPKLPPNPLAQA